MSPAKVIGFMMAQGEAVTVTVSLSDEAVELIGLEFGRE